MAEQLAKIYDPKTIEADANEIWIANSYFHAEPQAKGGNGKSYTIYITATVDSDTGGISYGFKAYDKRMADISHVNNTELTGDGSSTPWGPA